MSDIALAAARIRIRSLEASLDDAHAREQRLNGTVADLRERLWRIGEMASIDLPLPTANQVPLTVHTGPTGKIG